MNLETTYLGLRLRNPLVVGSAPFCDEVSRALQLEQAGAAAIVMRSLFAEQIEPVNGARKSRKKPPQPEMVAEFPDFAEYQLSPDRYLDQVKRLKETLSIPVIASLNGRHPGDWTDFAPRLEAAGADAIELNCFQVVTDPALSSTEVESAMYATLRGVAACVRIPIAVKISPFHSSIAQLAEALEIAGAAGIVLFNRFFQPDVDINKIAVESKLPLSNSSELPLRLRWLAILSPILRRSLAVTGGVHTADDVIKSILSGAHAVQVVSVLIKQGPQVLSTLVTGLKAWMAEHKFEDIDSFRGRLDLRRVGDASAIERANYIRVLQNWRI